MDKFMFVVGIFSLIGIVLFVTVFNNKFILLTSNRSGKHIVIRKDKVDIVYQQEDVLVGDKIIPGIVALTVGGTVYEVKDSFKTVIDQI